MGVQWVGLDNGPPGAPPPQQRHRLPIPLVLGIVHGRVARVVAQAEIGTRVEQHLHDGHAVGDLVLAEPSVGDVARDDGRDEGRGACSVAGVDVGADGEEETHERRLAEPGTAVRQAVALPCFCRAAGREGAVAEEGFDAVDVASAPRDEERCQATGIGDFEANRGRGGEESDDVGVAALGGELEGCVAGRARARVGRVCDDLGVDVDAVVDEQ